MTEKADKTKQRILECAKKEFLEKGFLGASLRTITKEAGVTTGALYGSFKDKDDIFNSIVEIHASYFLEQFTNAHTGFANLDEKTQITDMHSYTNNALEKLINYMFEHLDEFRLLISFSKGSNYQDWVEKIIAIEESSAHGFIKVLKKQGKKVEPLNPEIIHMLSGSFVNGVMETLVHQMGIEKAKKNIAILKKYSSAGWDALLGL